MELLGFQKLLAPNSRVKSKSIVMFNMPMILNTPDCIRLMLLTSF